MGVAQRLRGHPILAIGAMQIAAQHAEAVGEGARVRVKKWLFLHRIARRCTPREQKVFRRDYTEPCKLQAALRESGSNARMRSNERDYFRAFRKVGNPPLALARREHYGEYSHGTSCSYLNSALAAVGFECFRRSSRLRRVHSAPTVAWVRISCSAVSSN